MKKKHFSLIPVLYRSRESKIGLKMRATLIVLLICIGQTFAVDLYSQNKRLSLKMSNVPIKSVLEAIEDHSDFFFMYEAHSVNVEKKVTVSADNKSVPEILNDIFANTNITYKINNRQIALTAESQSLVGQQFLKVTGKVTDNTGGSLPGVSVVVKGTTQGTITDANGNYSLSNIPANASLQFSFIGMKSQEVKTTGKTIINVRLEEETVNLGEVVAVGYGVQRKSDLTGSTSQVKMSDMENKQAVSIADYLRGSIAGLNVSLSSSVTGSQSFEVRGPTSIGTNTAPLLVVDGMIFQGLLNDINPNDIESLNVLKDGSSAAIYGSRAAAGVIMITTKQGKTDKPTINIDAKVGISILPRIQPVYDVNGYLKMRGDALLAKESLHRNDPEYYQNPNSLVNVDLATWLRYDGSSVPLDSNPTEFYLQRLKLFTPEIANYNAGKSVDWLDKVFRTGLLKDYNLSMSGKTKTLNYYWSVGLLDNKGVIYNDDYKNIRSRVNLSADITKFLQVGMRSNLSVTSQNTQPANWAAAYTNSPLGDLYNADGTYTRYPNSFVMAQNPLDKTQYDMINRNYNVIGSLFAKLTLPLGIVYDLNYDNHWRFNSNYNYVPSYAVAGLTAIGKANRTELSQYDWSLDNILHWDRTFAGKHKVNVTLLYNSSRWMSNSTSANAADFSISEALTYHALDLGATPTVNSDDQVETRAAMMARLNYSYKDRYLLTASIRRDGYSAFGQLNPWATFPAVALAWRAKEESFMRSVNWISNLKFRVSYGINGNGDIGRYAALSKLSNGTYVRDQATIITLHPVSMPNAGLKWEQTSSFNTGIDLGLFNNRLNLVLDGYSMSTRDMLLPRTLPTISGYSTIMSNLGQLDNNGFEATINSVNFRRDNFNWSTSLTFSMNRNKIVHLYGDYVNALDSLGNVTGRKEADDPTNGRYIGHSLDAIYGYKIIGIWQTSEATQAAIYGRVPGDYKTMDLNGDGKFSPADYVWQGYKQPRCRLSMRNDFTIAKAFDVSFMMRAELGNVQAFNANVTAYADQISIPVYPYWTPDNPTNEWGALAFQKTGTVWKNSSFVRMDNLSIAYRLPQSFLKRLQIKTARMFINIDNVWSIDNHLDWDIETGNPTPRVFSLGLNFTM